MSKALAEIIQVRGGLARSVHLQRDFHTPDAVHNYVLTRFSAQLAARILSCTRSGTERAWSLTGPFGSGKSAFALFLAALATGHDSAFRKAAARVAKDASDDAASKVSPFVGRKEGLCPILVTGHRGSLAGAIASSAADALEAHLARRRGPKPLIRKLRALASAAEAGSGSAVELVKALERAASLVGQRKGDGLLIVIDELGKFLEHAAGHSASNDIYLLQQIAEAAARSGDTPILLVTLLHQAFERYATDLDRATREEWAKIQGRFADVPFLQPVEETAQVVGSALRRKASPANERAIAKWARQAAEQCCKLGLSRVKRGEDRKALVRTLARAYPIHPVALWALPLAFRQFAQNERSLFTFLAGGEPHSFQSFLQGAHLSSKLPVLSLPQLYDYFTANLGSSLSLHPSSGRWTEVGLALERLGDADPTRVAALKTVGFLNALGETSGLRPTLPLVQFALGTERVRSPLEGLLRDRILLRRRFDETYRIWEGSDFDFEQEYAQLRARYSPPRPLSHALAKQYPTRPLVARKVSISTGYLRFFSQRFVSIGELAEEGVLAEQDPADGQMILCVPESRHELASFEKRARGSRDTRTIFVIPRDFERLGNAVDEVSILRTLDSSTPALAGDRIARREVAARLGQAERHLAGLIAATFGPAGATWYWRGKIREITSKRAVSELLSAACTAAYRKAPRLLNELINRRGLSSAAAAARTELLVQMLAHGDQKELGIEGHPPQRAMYDTLLSETGIHRKRGRRGFCFGPPLDEAHAGVRAMWEACEAFLDSTESGRKPITELYAVLREKPFGMRDGTLPVFLLALLLAEDSNVSLYDNGSFVPSIPTELVEILVKKPELFEVQRCRIKGVRASLLRHMSKVLGGSMSRAPAKQSLLDIIKPMCSFAAALPDYARKTRSVSVKAQEVRQCLLRATEPDQLLFSLLPKACGYDPFPADGKAPKGRAGAFASDLAALLRELQTSLEKLAGNVEERLLMAFDIEERGERGRESLRVRARPLLSFTIDPLLRAFAFRASDEKLELTQWVDSMAALLAQKPLAAWIDHDLVTYESRLHEVRRTFRHAESLCFGTQQARESLKERFEAIRIGVTSPTEGEKERVAIVTESQRSRLDQGIGALHGALREEGLGADREVALAALARVAMEYLEEAESEPEVREGIRDLA